MTIRSSRLALAQVTTLNNGVLLATVPTGEIWLVKSALFYCTGSSAATVFCYLRDQGATVLGMMFKGSVPASGQNQFTGWAVASAGDSIYVQTDVSPLHVWISGAKLQG